MSLQAAVNGQRFVLDPAHWLQGIEAVTFKRPLLDVVEARRQEFVSPYYSSPMFKLRPTDLKDDILPRVDYVPAEEWVKNLTVESWWKTWTEEHKKTVSAETTPVWESEGVGSVVPTTTIPRTASFYERTLDRLEKIFYSLP